MTKDKARWSSGQDSGLSRRQRGFDSRTSHQKVKKLKGFKYKRIVGVDDAEGPPVPIPNTEVKLSGAENTWLVTARKDREMPTQSIHPNGCFALYSSIAQSVERMTVNHDVTGSSPVGGATTE